MNVPDLFGFFPSMPSGSELIIVGIVALLIFGRRLPEVARSLGKGIVEFKKGIADVEAEVERAGSDDYATNTATEDTTEGAGSEPGSQDVVDAAEDVETEDPYSEDAYGENTYEEDYGTGEDYGVEEHTETQDLADESQPRDPVDDTETYEPYDGTEETSEQPAEQDETPEDEADRSHRDDATPSD